jgi:hypothetical protein
MEETVEREFTPSEMQRITGISPALQRTWRQRGILPDGGWLGENRPTGWTRWTLNDVLLAKVFKLAGDLGFNRKAAFHIALRTLAPVHHFLRSFEGSTIFVINGHTIKPRKWSCNEPDTRFLVVAHSERGITYYDADELDQRISTHKDASTVPAAIESSDGQGYALLDLKQIAQDIFDRCGGHLFRMEIEEPDFDEEALRVQETAR